MNPTLPAPNLTDVALVDPRALAQAMQHLVATGRGLAMLNGISKDELREVDAALSDALGRSPAERIAVLVRLRCLIEVFAQRRLRQLFLATGYNLIAPAVHVAARQRLNAERGFNLVKFERALAELMAKIAAARVHDSEMGLAA